jgi:hypothetical protein
VLLVDGHAHKLLVGGKRMIWMKLNLSEDTINILNELVVRKKRLDRYKQLRLAFTLATMVLLAFFSLYFYRYVLMPSNKNMFQILIALTDKMFLFTLTGLAVSFMLMSSYTELYNKHKIKYDLLRAETIDLFFDPWGISKNAAVRDTISKDLKETYDINISFKS